MGGLRWLIMWSASSHEAQYAASAHRPPERSPSPPTRMERDANLFSVLEFVCCAWSSPRRATAVLHMPASCAAAYSRENSGGNVRIMWLARGLALGRGNYQPHCTSGTRGIASHRSLLVKCSRVTCALPMGDPKTLMPSACQASGPSWCTSRGGLLHGSHTLVFPWCKRMPATRKRHSATVS